jgi:hypothetical protein
MPDIKKIKLGSITYDIVDGTHKNIIILEDNGSTAAGTWLAKTNRISAYEDGQLFIYRVTVAGASATTLNVTGANGSALGARGVFRGGGTSSKLTTQYAVGSQILLYFCKPKSTDDGYFVTINDYPADSDKKTSSGNTSSKIFLIGATTQSSSGQTTYSHDTAYVGTDGCLYSGSTKVSVVGHIHDVTAASAAPNAHTHTVTVKGTTGANSGTAVAAATAVKVSSTSSVAPGGHTHTYDKATGVTLTANTEAASGRLTYVESVTHTKPSLSGTTTFIKSVSGGSGSLKAYDAETNGTVVDESGRIKYVDSITSGSAVGTGTGSAAPNGHTHSYARNTYSLTGSNTSHVARYLKATTTAASTGTVGISGGSGSLTNDGTSANGLEYVEKQGTFSAGTTPVASATFSGTKTTALVTSATSRYLHWEDGSLPTLTVTSTGVVTGVTFNAGTTPKSGATPNHTSTASGSATSTTGTIASYASGVLSINATTSVAGHTHTYDKTSSITLTAGTAPSLTTSTTNVGSASGWSAGSLPSLAINTTSTGNLSTIITGVTKGDYTPGGSISLTRGTAPSMGAATTKYLKHSHVAASLTGTKTFVTSAISGVSLAASTTSTDGPAYVQSMTNSNLALSKGNTEGATSGANNGTAVPTISGVSYTAPAATTYWLDHTHTPASGTNGTVSLSQGSITTSTKYLSAVPTYTTTTSAANSGTNVNAATAVAVDTTANVAPAGHTHSYGSDTALTTSGNSGTAIAAVTEVKAATN